MPEEFGKVALVASYISILQTIVQIGITSWLVQAKEVKQIDFSTTFLTTLFVSIILYLCIFIASPSISAYYNDQQLTSILRTQGLGIIITSLFVVQSSKLRRELKFREIFIVQVCATLIQGLVGVGSAFFGLGVWALVYSNLSYLIVTFIGIYYLTRELSLSKFSFFSLKKQFWFSFRILLNSLSDSLLNLFISTLIYKNFDAMTLGFYNRGSVLPILVISNIDGAINSVMFPIISRVYNETKDIKELVRRSFLVSFFFIFPAMIGLSIISKPMITFLFSSKWNESSVFMQIVSLTVTTWIFSIFSNTINAMGRSDLTFKINIFIKSISIIIIIISYNFGIIPFLFGIMFYSFLQSLIHCTLAHRIIGYTFLEQLRDLFPIIMNTLIMGFVVGIIVLITNFSPSLTFVYIVFGICLYISGAIWMRIDIFYFIKSIFLEYSKSIFRLNNN